jgi:hypothetical protein
MSATIIFDAEPFCFGPISTTLNIIRELRALAPRSELRIVLLGTLTSRQLADASDLVDDVIECDTSDEALLLSHRRLIESADLYLSNTNFNSVKLLQKHGITTPVAFVDTLFWMWDVIDPIINTVSPYYVQDFWGVRDRVASLGAGGDNVRIIDPLVSARSGAPQTKRDLILINLGGIENIYWKGRYFADALVSVVLDAIDRVPELAHYQKVIAGGGERIQSIKTDFEDESRNVHVGCFSQEAFLNLLDQSQYFFSLPGITSFVEAVLHKANLFLMLPQNYSQQLQLRRVRSFCSGVFGRSWDEFQGLPHIRDYEPELEGLARVHQCNQRFFASPELIEEYSQCIEHFLRSSRSQMALQRPELPFFSGDSNGPAEVATDILRRVRARAA